MFSTCQAAWTKETVQLSTFPFCVCVCVCILCMREAGKRLEREKRREREMHISFRKYWVLQLDRRKMKSGEEVLKSPCAGFFNLMVFLF